MLKTMLLLNILWKPYFFQLSLMKRKLKSNVYFKTLMKRKLKSNVYFKTEIKCVIINVFTVTFDQSNASLLNNSKL